MYQTRYQRCTGSRRLNSHIKQQVRD